MLDPAPDTITLILERVSSGGAKAESELFDAVYDELRRMAISRAASQGSGSVLQATALVNEAYLKLRPGNGKWEGRAHFFGAAARAMRNIVADDARRRSRAKHGGAFIHVELDSQVQAPSLGVPGHVLEINDALERLLEEQPGAARVVELRYFAGLSDAETAKALGVSLRTVFRQWAFAKAWLSRELDRNPGADR